MMEFQGGKKRKGGAKKIRDKKQKSLEESAKKCQKISSMFCHTNTQPPSESIDETSASNSEVCKTSSQDLTSTEKDESQLHDHDVNYNEKKREQLTDLSIHAKPTTLNSKKINFFCRNRRIQLAQQQ